MKKTFIIIGIVVAILVLTLFVFKRGPSVKTIHVEAYQFGFEPSTIEVNKGDKVRLVLTSRDVPHGLGIIGYNIKKDFGKEPVTLEFIADKNGTFPFYCSVLCGAGHDAMRGSLIVK